MRSIFVWATSSTTPMYVLFNSPSSLFIGATMTFANVNSSTGAMTVVPQDGSVFWFGGTAYTSAVNFSLTKYTSKTFVYLGNITPNFSNPTWVALNG